MTRQRVGIHNRIRGAVAVATVCAMSLGLAAPVLAADSATFSGAVMAPDNSFAQGFTVVFKDVATGQEFRSGPTTATGEYQVAVPTGARYKLDSVLAPDGTKLPVQNVPPIPVRVAGTSKLDVKFTNAPAVAAAPTGAAPAAAGTAVAAAAPAAKTPAPAATTPAAKPASAPPPQTSVASTTPAASDEKKKKDKSAVPWWKRPGPIVGMVLGGAAIVALAVGGGGGGGNTASQSTP